MASTYRFQGTQIIAGSSSIATQINALQQNQAEDVITALELTLPFTPITEPKIAFNVINLAAGDFGGATLLKENTRVLGNGGTRITMKVICKADAMFNNVHFISTPTLPRRNNRDYLVRVQNTSSVCFTNCIFEKSEGDLQSAVIANNQAFVIVDAWSSASFTSCIFTGSVTGSGFVTVNKNVESGSVGILGCINKTGLGHSNVHIAFEMRNK